MKEIFKADLLIRDLINKIKANMKEEIEIGKLEVLKSNAGYYIGRMCVSEGVTQPYSRESSYYRTREAAQKDLISNNYFRP